MIRRAEVDDADAIAGVLHDAFIEYHSLYAPERYAATVCLPQGIRDRLEEGPSWVALVDGKVVGTVSVLSRGAGETVSKSENETITQVGNPER